MAAGDKGLVTGGTVNTAITNAVNTKANTSLDNITDNGKTVIRNLSKEAVKLENGTNTTVESRTDGNTTLYKVNVSSTSITDAIAPKLSELSTTVDTKLAIKANKDASNLTNENVKEWTAKLGTGIIGQGESSNGLVTGKSVYEAIQQHSQGLDQKLTKAINVGTATASALAALHPLDYDEANKVSFAVSHGQFNGSKATAFGGFVRPNENIMLSLASTISSNDRAWNAGLSFKIGSGSSHKKISQNDFETLRKKNDKLENELNQLKEQLSKLSIRLSPKRDSFPDVPKEHWANEAVETLHGNDVLDGYPDGQFKGDKQLTRYEYAQMLFKGLK